jgi:hypothetical protein
MRVFPVSIRRITKFAEVMKDYGKLAKCSSNIDVGRLHSRCLSLQELYFRSMRTHSKQGSDADGALGAH